MMKATAALYQKDCCKGVLLCASSKASWRDGIKHKGKMEYPCLL